MKITYLKMENLKNILAGMGKSKVEIDFSKGKNDKILLLGGNGSGKSIILSSATPYRGTNDNRSVDPVEGKTGKKVIHFDHNGHKYEIEHFYGKNNKSYIKKDGRELNENGNIRSFNAVMEEELEISPDYFAIGRLGDNVKNFINYPTAERKKYINKFIPNIDDYLIAYKNSSEKVTLYNKRLKSLNVQLEKYNTLDELLEVKKELEDEKETLGKEISKMEIQLESILNEIGKLSQDLMDKDNYSTEIIFNKHPQFKEMAGHYLPGVINTIEKEALVIQDDLDVTYLKYPKLKGKTLEDCKEKLNELSNKKKLLDVELENIEFKVNHYKSQVNDSNSKMAEIKAKLNSFENMDVDQITEMKTELEGRYNDRRNLISHIKSDEFPITLEEAKLLKDDIKLLKRESGRVSESRGDLDEKLFDKYKFDIDTLIGLYNTECDKKDKLEQNIAKLDKEMKEIYKESGLVKILEVSEHHDHAKECPFVPMAMGVQDRVDGIDGMEEEMKSLHTQLNEVIIPRIEVIRNHIKYVKEFKEVIVNSIYNERFEKLGIDKDDYMNTLLVTDSSKFDNKFAIVDEVIGYYTDLEEIKTLQTKLESIESKLELNRKIESDRITLNEELNVHDKTRVDSLSVLTEEINPEKERIEKDIKINTASTRIYEVLEAKLTKLNNIMDVVNELKELSDEMKVIDGKMLELRDQKNQYIVDIDNKNAALNHLIGKLDKANRDYYLVESINKELSDISSIYDKLLAVNTSLDPKKGIPLIFINNYLTDIAERANDLLDMAYKGDFFIKFEVNEKEFKIIVVKGDGTELEDISLASQGETAMTNTSLSLSMLANITKGYNIMYFDEVDGTLDNENRRNFLSVLDRQIKTLGSEQTFIISHNNEFYSADVDLILLDKYETKIDINDKQLMANKTILYKN